MCECTRTGRNWPKAGTAGALFVAALALTWFYTAGSTNFVLSDPDEARCALIARQMVTSGDWLVPRLGGKPYFDKPPLYFWILAGTMRVLGEDEWSLRLPSAIIAAAFVALTAALTADFYGRRAALWAAATMALSAGSIIGSRVIRMDMLLAVCIAAALLCWERAFLLQRSRRWYLAAYFAAALGCLTKGPVALVIPAIAIFAYCLLTRQIGAIFRMRLLSGLAIVLLVAGPWFAYMAWSFPDYAWEFFWRQHIARYFGSGLGRNAPWWYLPGSLVAALMPWTFLVAAAAWLYRPTLSAVRERATLLLWCWGLVVLALFLPSKSKLPNYLLPMLPPTFALLGRFLADAEGHRRLLLAAFAATLASAAAVLAGWPVAEHLRFGSADLTAAAVRLAGLAAIAAVTLWLCLRRPHLAAVPLLLGAGSFTLDLASHQAPAYFRSRSSAPLAATLGDLEPARYGATVYILTEPRWAMVYYAPAGWQFQLIDERHLEEVKPLLAQPRAVLAVLTGRGIYRVASESLGPRLRVLAEWRGDRLVEILPQTGTTAPAAQSQVSGSP